MTSRCRGMRQLVIGVFLASVGCVAAGADFADASIHRGKIRLTVKRFVMETRETEVREEPTSGSRTEDEAAESKPRVVKKIIEVPVTEEKSVDLAEVVAEDVKGDTIPPTALARLLKQERRVVIGPVPPEHRELFRDSTIILRIIESPDAR